VARRTRRFRPKREHSIETREKKPSTAASGEEEKKETEI
jgi:hypothetical protein